MARIIAGFLCAPAVFPALSLASGAVWSGVELALAISYASTVIFDVPLFFVLKRQRWLRWWQVIVAAAACAIPASTLLMDFTNPQIRHLTNTLQLMGVGAIAGLSFWAIALACNSALTTRSTRTRAEASGKS